MNRWHLDTLVVCFEIDCNPLPKERPRTIRRKGKSITFTPKRTRDYEAYVALLARQAMGDREPEKGLVAVQCVFYRARRTADCDNLLKAVLDSIVMFLVAFFVEMASIVWSAHHLEKGCFVFGDFVAILIDVHNRLTVRIIRTPQKLPEPAVLVNHSFAAIRALMLAFFFL